MTTTHTKGPWNLYVDYPPYRVREVGKKGAEIMPAEEAARRLNSYDDLLAALNEAVVYQEFNSRQLDRLEPGWVRLARAALAQAQPNSNASPASPARAEKKGTQPTPAPRPEGSQP